MNKTQTTYQAHWKDAAAMMRSATRHLRKTQADSIVKKKGGGCYENTRGVQCSCKP